MVSLLARESTFCILLAATIAASSEDFLLQGKKMYHAEDMNSRQCGGIKYTKYTHCGVATLPHYEWVEYRDFEGAKKAPIGMPFNVTSKSQCIQRCVGDSKCKSATVTVKNNKFQCHFVKWISPKIHAVSGTVFYTPNFRCCKPQRYACTVRTEGAKCDRIFKFQKVFGQRLMGREIKSYDASTGSDCLMKCERFKDCAGALITSTTCSLHVATDIPPRKEPNVIAFNFRCCDREIQDTTLAPVAKTSKSQVQLVTEKMAENENPSNENNPEKVSPEQPPAGINAPSMLKALLKNLGNGLLYFSWQ